MGGCTHPASSRLGKVHVWTAWLVDDDDTTAHHVGILDADERARADAFQRPWDRGRFVQSHGIVRRLLARYTGIDVAALRFQYGPQGKPSVANSAWASELHFSLSHSANCCLVAIRMGGAVGIDVEECRALPSAADIARHHFAASESKLIAERHGPGREDVFYTLWTHKEAVVKTLGESLGDHLDRLEFDLDPSGRARLASLDGDRSIGDRWSVVRLDGLPGYVAAVAGCPGFETVERFVWKEQRVQGESPCHPHQVSSSPKSIPARSLMQYC